MPGTKRDSSGAGTDSITKENKSHTSSSDRSSTQRNSPKGPLAVKNISVKRKPKEGATPIGLCANYRIVL